jgi:hypothetical protein
MTKYGPDGKKMCFYFRASLTTLKYIIKHNKNVEDERW